MDEQRNDNFASDDAIGYLLKYCSRQGLPELYNKVSNMVYKQFNIHSAEIALICTWVINEYYGGDIG